MIELPTELASSGAFFLCLLCFARCLCARESNLFTSATDWPPADDCRHTEWSLSRSALMASRKAFSPFASYCGPVRWDDRCWSCAENFCSGP